MIKTGVKIVKRFVDFNKARMRKIAVFSVEHFLFLGGMGVSSYGVWLFYHPLGSIVGGMVMVRIALLLSDESQPGANR